MTKKKISKKVKKTKGVKKSMTKSCNKSCKKKCADSKEQPEKTTGDFHQVFSSDKDFQPQQPSLWSKIKRMLGL